MKSKDQKRKEAQARSAHRATLTNDQKLRICFSRPGQSKNEIRRLTVALNAEKAAGSVVLPSTKCERRKR